MTLRKSKVFRAIGYTLAGLAVFTAIAHVAQRALFGGWNDTYRSAKLVPWTYGGAFIVLCAAAVVGLIWLCLYVRRRWSGYVGQKR